jgi:predicted hydrocarbon binding protein
MANSTDIRIPVDSIQALRSALSRELGTDAAARALREAGFAAGDAIAGKLDRGPSDQDVGETPATTFWDRFATLFREMGWGSLRHEELHPGVGAFTVTDWFEIDPASSSSACPFTTGVLANVLGSIAGRPVAVMQVPCPAQPGCARFVFGSASVLDEIYADLRDGQELDGALAALG